MNVKKEMDMRIVCKCGNDMIQSGNLSMDDTDITTYLCLKCKNFIKIIKT